MREILFRGKRFSNGEWVVGGIIKTFHPNYDCKTEEDFFSQTPNCYCICANNKDYFVEQDSIGQYTGLADKNGKKIFEGDIVRGAWNTVFAVYFDEQYLQFRAKKFDGYLSEIDYYGDSNKIEVIGNIHDNPEFSKGEIKWMLL